MDRIEIDRRALDFTRFLIAKAVAEDGRDVQRYAEARWGLNSMPAGIAKAAVAAGRTDASAWGGPLFQQAGAEFFEMVRERSLVGRMSGIRQVPLEAKIVGATGSANAAWVGEGQTIPVTKGAFAIKPAMVPTKIVAMTVQTNDLLKLSDPSAELIIRDDLVAAAVEALDQTFTDPSNAGVDGVMPAAISNGAPTVASLGDGANLDADLVALIANFDGDLTRAYFLANPETYTLFSDSNRPNIGARGGEMLGIPALASRKVPVGNLILADAGGIALATGATEVDASSNGAVQLDTAPDSPATSSTVMVSLWQSNMTALRAILYANWKAQPGAVAVLTGLSNLGDSP